jgi:phosphodiesterase/alkaline phosphatase D-like protein
MNKGIFIGLIAVALIATGGVLLINKNKIGTEPETATSTVLGVTTKDTDLLPQQSGAPLVTTTNTAVPSNATAVLTGKVTPNGAQTAYWYEYGVTNMLGTRTNPQTIGSGFVAISAPAYVTNLGGKTEYFYRLVAQNTLGTTAGATYTFTTNTNPPPQGGAPTTHTEKATNITRTTANLNGQTNANGSQTTYWFEYGESADLGSVTQFQSASNGTKAIETAIALSDLKPQTIYYFRVNAQNQYGTANGATMNFTTGGPANTGAPTGTTDNASAIGSTSATLNGHVRPNGVPTIYWFEYGKDGLLQNIIGNTPHSEITGSDTTDRGVETQIMNLQKKTTYFYRIAVTNSYGTTRGSIVQFQTKN